MSKNCLITKCKAAVQNSDLVKPEELKVKSTGNDSTFYVSFYVNPGSGTVTYTPTIRVAEGNALVNGSPVEDGNCPVGVMISLTGTVALSNKYNMISLEEHHIAGTPDDYQYMTNLLSLSVGRVGSCAKLKNLHLFHFDAREEGNTDIFEGLTGSRSSLHELFIRVDSPVNIVELAKFINLTRLILAYNAANPLSVEAFVQQQRINGRTTTSSEGIDMTGSFTFNGNTISLTRKILTWTEDTITLDGVTINA